MRGGAARACLAGPNSFAITAATKMLRVRGSSKSACSQRAGRIFMADIRVLATDLEFPEGPVVMPDGSVVLVEIRGRRLTRVWPDGRKEVVAQIPGGPNGAALGPDGKIYVCNNGGFSWAPSRGTMMPGPPSAAQYIGGPHPPVGLSTRHGRNPFRQMRAAPP